MYTLNEAVFRQHLKEKGYRSYGELAQKLNLHRNTIQYYLSGHGVLPEKLEQILDALNIPIEKAFVKFPEKKEMPFEKIAPLIDDLLSAYPNCCFVLFGSRARNKHGKYADWDVGIYSKNGLPHAVYRDLIKKKNELMDRLPYLMDLVNLNQADSDFLKELSKDWIFLAGRAQDWLDLN